MEEKEKELEEIKRRSLKRWRGGDGEQRGGGEGEKEGEEEEDRIGN